MSEFMKRPYYWLTWCILVNLSDKRLTVKWINACYQCYGINIFSQIFGWPTCLFTQLIHIAWIGCHWKICRTLASWTKRVIFVSFWSDYPGNLSWNWSLFNLKVSCYEILPAANAVWMKDIELHRRRFFCCRNWKILTRQEKLNFYFKACKAQPKTILSFKLRWPGKGSQHKK